MNLQPLSSSAASTVSRIVAGQYKAPGTPAAQGGRPASLPSTDTTGFRAATSTQLSADTIRALQSTVLTNRTLETGVYVETDRLTTATTRFGGRGVHLMNTVFAGFAAVKADASVELPYDIDSKLAVAAPSARKVISFGGATYAATFLALLTDSTKVELLADRIAAVATAKGTDVDIDAEFPQNDAQAKGLAQLITRLAEKLPKGRVYFAAPTLYDVDHTVSHPDVQAAVLNHPNIYINIFGYDLTRTPNPAAGDPGYTKGSCLWDDGSQAQVQWFPTRDGAGKTGRLSVEYLVDYIADRLTETAPSRRADVLSRMILGTPAYSAVHHYTQSQMTYEDVDGDCMVTQVSGPSGQDWAVSDENIPFILGFAREKGMGGIQVYEAGHLKDSSRLTVIARGGFIDVITPDTSPTGGAVGTGTSSNPAVFDGGPLTITDKTGTVCATAFPGKACASATLSGGNFDLSGSFVELVSSAQLPVSFASMQYYFNQLKDPANLSAGNTLTAVDREYQLISSAGTHVGSFIVAGKMTAAQMTALKSMLQNPVPGGSVKVRDNLTGSTSGSSGGTGTTGSSGGTTGGTTGGTATTGTSGGASVGNSSGTGTVNFDGKLPIIKDQSASVCATSFSGKRCASALITGQNYKVDVSFVELDSWAGLPIEFKSINTYFTHINQAPYLNNGDLMSPMNLEYQLISSGNAHVGSFIVQGHLTMAQRNELKSILEYTVPGGSVQIRDGNAPTTPASTATETESGSPAWADALIGIGSFAAVSAFVYGAYRWVRAADVAPPTVGGDPTTPQPPAPPAALAEVVVEFDVNPQPSAPEAPYTEIGTHADATGAPGTLGYDGALPDAHSYPAASAPEFTKLEEEEKQMPIITPREAAISEAPREFADRNDDPVNESEIPPRPDSRLSIESDRSVISSVSSHTVTSET